VTTDIAEFLPATLELVFVAGAMMVAIGVPLGILSARYRDSWIDNLIRLLTLLGVSAPAFVWAVILMLLFSYFTPLFPIAGRISDTFAIDRTTGFLFIDTLLAGNIKAFGNAAWHIILPAFALALSGIGQAARLTRANMVETYERPYIEMAQSYGFPERRIANKYAFRPSMIPSLTIIGLDFAAMLGNAFLVEAVFAWPGLSRYGVAVILRKDLNAIIGTVLIISAMFLIVNVVVDLLIAFINPRIRYSQRPA
jgi:peptide/nickel transport system permease protein